MKRSQLKSPVGSPSFQKTVRAKQKKGLGGGSVASGDGTGKGTAQRRAEAKAREARSLPRPCPPPMGEGVKVTSEEVDILNAQWDRGMDERLREGVLRYGGAWGEVSKHMTPCMCPSEELEKRWQMVKHRPVKGPWATEEDSLLKILVEEHGSKKWSLIATQFPGRTGKQCRERWLNHLDARVRKSAWTGGEDLVLWEAQSRLGNKWSEISKLLPGRAENAVKNRFNSLITKRMAHQRGLSQQLRSKTGSSIKPQRGYDAEGRYNASSGHLEDDKKAPIGFESMEAYDTDCDSSEDDGDVLAFPGDMEEGTLPSTFAVTGYGQNTTHVDNNDDIISGKNIMALPPPTLSKKAFITAPADGGRRGGNAVVDDASLLHSLFGLLENSGGRSPPNSSSSALRPLPSRRHRLYQVGGAVEPSSKMNPGPEGGLDPQGTTARQGNNSSSTRHDTSSSSAAAAMEGAQAARRQAGGRKRVGAAVPTRKAAMKIEHGAGSGGVDVRDGQASVITEAWSRVQIKAQQQQDASSPSITATLPRARVTSTNNINTRNARRTEPTTRSSSASLLCHQNKQGSSSEGVSSEEAIKRGGAREGLNPDTLAALRTEDNVIPTPLEIDIDIPSPGGIQERDAPTLSCLGSYALTPIRPADGGSGQPSNAPRAISSSSRTTFVVGSGKHVNRSDSEPSPRHWGHCLKTAMAAGSSMGGGGGAKGQGAVLEDALHNLASLSLDDDSSNCWSQLKTDVASPTGPTFGDVSPMSLGLMSAGESAEVLGAAAQGFPAGPSMSAKTQTLPQPVYPLFTPFGASSPGPHGATTRAVGNPEESSSNQRAFPLVREEISLGAGSNGYIGGSGNIDGIGHQQHHQVLASIPRASYGPIRSPPRDDSGEQQLQQQLLQQQQQQQSVMSSIGGVLTPNDHHQARRGDNRKESDEVGVFDATTCGTTSGNGVRRGVEGCGVYRGGGPCYGDYYGSGSSSNNNNDDNGNVGGVLRSLPGAVSIQQQQHWEQQRMVEAEERGTELLLSPPLEGGPTAPASFSSGWI